MANLLAEARTHVVEVERAKTAAREERQVAHALNRETADLLSAAQHEKRAFEERLNRM